ncbi:MAG TPA: VWA domain-containing protein [Polyangia bacterium]|nr:VWA domain-containing protein [Polyangia bacterium]
MGFFALPDFLLGGLSAGASAGIALAGAALLTGLYLLKLQRRRVLVAFSPLWTALGGERRSERWARQLRRWVSLLLQLVFLALLVLAAADPRPAAADRGGRSVVILIDRSASMGARDEDGLRIGRARRAAQEIVAGMAAGDRLMIVSFAASVTPESGFEDDAARLRASIERVGAGEEPGDLRGALAFARAVLRERPHPTLVLISDGAFSEDARRQVRWTEPGSPDDGGLSLAGVDVRFVPVGRRRDNVAILSFGARRKPGDLASVEAALVVQNFRAVASKVLVEIVAGPQRVAIERVRLTLEPDERRRHVLPDVPAADTRLEATLLSGDAGTAAVDDLAVDDRAFAVIPAAPRLKILRVGEGNLFLDGALLSLGDAVDVRRAKATAAAGPSAGNPWNAYDVVIFDGVTPPQAPTAGRFLYLDPSGPGSPFAVRGTLSDPIVSETKAHHPLLRHLALTDINIARARRLALATDDMAVASALGNPLIIARTRPNLRVVALAFDVRQSDLPMRSAFPLLLANSLSFLAGNQQSQAVTLRTGQTARLPAPNAAAALSVVDPHGQRRRLLALGDSFELPVTSVGFYSMATAGDGGSGRAGGGVVRTLAANLNDAIESDTAPVPRLSLGGRLLPLVDQSQSATPTRGGRHRSYGSWALMVAAALTLFEWWSYHRRWTV